MVQITRCSPCSGARTAQRPSGRRTPEGAEQGTSAGAQLSAVTIQILPECARIGVSSAGQPSGSHQLVPPPLVPFGSWAVSAASPAVHQMAARYPPIAASLWLPLDRCPRRGSSQGTAGRGTALASFQPFLDSQDVPAQPRPPVVAEPVVAPALRTAVVRERLRAANVTLPPAPPQVHRPFDPGSSQWPAHRPRG